MAESVFEVVDYSGMTVSLFTKVWESKLLSPAPIGHPEVTDYLSDIRLAIT